MKVKASGLRGSDCFIQNETWLPVDYPRIPGHEATGRVIALGSAVESNRLKVESLLDITSQYNGFTFNRGHGEYMREEFQSIIQIPEEALQTASCAELAHLLCGGTTVYGAVRSSNQNPGDVAIVQGVGGLGHLAIQYAAKLGLKVYAISSGSSKAELVKSLGAVAHVNASTTYVVAYFQALGGEKLIICTAPRAKLISSILPAVDRNGTLTLVSAAVDGNIEMSNSLSNMNQ
ncbi:hypothetical protein ACEPAG_719 [Sanghuangporus baumii]